MGPSPPAGPDTVAAAAARNYMHMRIVTLNIRYATTSPTAGEHVWSIRCPKLCAQLDFVTAGRDNAFVCLQEVLASQLADIQHRLGASWAHIGRGRDDGRSAGEHSPVFYRPDVWRCEAHETRWLSESPDTPSRGWDAALPRIVTIGRFAHRQTGSRLVVMSTHFDHLGVEARKNSARLLIQFAAESSRPAASDQQEPSAVLVGGDFNSTTQDGAYRIMIAPGSSMSDLADLVPLQRHYGNHLTYTSFGEPEEWPQRIDFLFVHEPRTAVVKTFGVLANSFDDQIRISDHRAVVSDLDIVV
ncbi:Uncharacterized protein ESCO_006404 [Escovopsis weberi]|uniref:Endonuclease/exonuclease/phosphatase domain-containing protein n=1 Tax=Escovopsis weberi TaxID=150374 RepID=A0A0M8MS13_ESCWE|nr:Uncharacterized protein ESCO_006404 [Escovopsis weberi]